MMLMLSWPGSSNQHPKCPSCVQRNLLNTLEAWDPNANILSPVDFFAKRWTCWFKCCNSVNFTTKKYMQLISLPSILHTSNQQQKKPCTPPWNQHFAPENGLVGSVAVISFPFHSCMPPFHQLFDFLRFSGRKLPSIPIHPLHPIQATLSLRMHPPGFGICSAS